MGAGIIGAEVTGADVTGAGVTGAGVTRAVVVGADVMGAGIIGVGVTGAGVITGADVMGAGITGAGVTGAVVTGADVMGAGVTGRCKNVCRLIALIRFFHVFLVSWPMRFSPSPLSPQSHSGRRRLALSKLARRRQCTELCLSMLHVALLGVPRLGSCVSLVLLPACCLLCCGRRNGTVYSTLPLIELADIISFTTFRYGSSS
jgi:hypothetical protein